MGSLFAGFEFGAHDPTRWGWAVVVVYLFAAACSLGAGLARRRRVDRGRTRLEWFWYGCALFLIALAINKQLDLHGYAEKFVAREAWYGGWYWRRQVFQRLFIRAVAGAGVVVALVLLVYYRRGTPAHWLAIAGLIGLEAFIAIRASSFHDMDALISRNVVSNLRVSHAFEMGGGLVVAGAALLAALVSLERERRQKPRRARAPADGHAAGVGD